MKALVVDDDPVVRCVVRALLAEAGYDVRCCCDGEEAWRVQGEFCASLIVSDWMMPVTDGLQLCSRIRSAGDDSVYFLLISSNLGAPQSKQRAYEAGVDDLLEKPVLPAALAEHLRRAKVAMLHQGGEN